MALEPAPIPPEILRKAFFSLQSPRELAVLLGLDYGRLVFNVYKLPDLKKYERFEIRKKTGGARTIKSPSRGLKFIQSKLCELLTIVYKPKPSAYGFVQGRNIVQNASKHTKRRWVLNIDLEDFFPSINFGRVRGMFIGKPYQLNPKVATFIAQICCFENELPQGAPTSPIISNMICAQMDSQLQELAWTNRCFYTRYADDITFSTTLPKLPSDIANVTSLKNVSLGHAIQQIIKDNGFFINHDKVRAYSRLMRQEVTGLTVNKVPNVRRKFIFQIRAMLHAWEKYGLARAENEYQNNYSKRKHRNPELPPPIFKKVVKGKIDYLGMVKGKKNKIYLRYKGWYIRLLSRDKGIPSLPRGLSQKPLVYVEGPTDVKTIHLAWNILFPNTSIPFELKDSSPPTSQGSGGGTSNWLEIFRGLREGYTAIHIGILDRDDAGIRTYESLPKDYISDSEKDWKFSSARKAICFLLPIPKGREKYAVNRNLCIEFYFKDELIILKDSTGKGLTFSLRIGNQEISDGDDPKVFQQYSEQRRIKDDGGKMIFSKDIITGFEAIEFEPFKLLFEKIFDAIKTIQDNTDNQKEYLPREKDIISE